ncbi:hypothetical protein PspLS_11570 [Pyricularia sp. CBS 133598]|nr:hypothetical protein PspLS_11570 [Pyricularia sp. CBS 133598]
MVNPARMPHRGPVGSVGSPHVHWRLYNFYMSLSRIFLALSNTVTAHVVSKERRGDGSGPTDIAFSYLNRKVKY